MVKKKYFRILHGFTQDQLVQATGFGISTLQKYESDEQKPKPEQLLKISQALGISINVFMDFDIHTVSDLLSLIFKMNEQLDLNFNAEEDLKTIYHASDEEKARLALDRVTEKWTAKYPNFMKRWYDNWDAITPIFKFSPDVRKVIYTTNAIESLNSTYRKLNRQRSVFPSDTALLKALYLATFEATKKWTMSIRNWGQVYGELSIMYEERLPE